MSRDEAQSNRRPGGAPPARLNVVRLSEHSMSFDSEIFRRLRPRRKQVEELLRRGAQGD